MFECGTQESWGKATSRESATARVEDRIERKRNPKCGCVPGFLRSRFIEPDLIWYVAEFQIQNHRVHAFFRRSRQMVTNQTRLPVGHAERR